MNRRNVLWMATIGVGLAAPTAWAGPFIIDVGTDFSGNDRTTTEPIRTLGFSNIYATSFYLGDPNTIGTTIIDTNILSEMNGLGYSAGTYPALDGTSQVTLRDPNMVADRSISRLQYEDSDTSGINAGNRHSGENWASPDNEGWGLTFDYRIEGRIVEGPGGDPEPYFDSGYFDVFYQNGPSEQRTQVLRMVLEDSVLQAPNLDLLGILTYEDFDSDSALVQDFFLDTETGRTFYDLITEGEVISISWRLDTNVDPPLPLDSNLADLSAENGDMVFARQTELSGSVRYQVNQVPEPTTIGLLGLGLMWLAWVMGKGRRSKMNLRAS
ncbi:PEP-CTERM sorting domain-containing protein [Halorhodospira halophila]|uniref:PEP-CTERM sorting domain-containing protein n=1 Tax=Halorhodospira halophila TaxID=1053 RepID=UPI0019128B51|nr:PEP-CTERM sorting domain-containing protein [Halorhodospira halophila]MBK5943850.1 hypothetical protein [Halorhodospira halophila]